MQHGEYDLSGFEGVDEGVDEEEAAEGGEEAGDGVEVAAVLQGAAEAAARAEAVQEAEGSGVLPGAAEAAAQAEAAAVVAGVFTPRMRAQGAPAAVPPAPGVGGAAPPGAAPAPEVGTAAETADDELAGGGGGGGAHARREQAMAKQLEMARAITAGDALDVFFSARTVSLCPTASPARRKQARPSYPTYPYGMSASRLSTLS